MIRMTHLLVVGFGHVTSVRSRRQPHRICDGSDCFMIRGYFFPKCFFSTLYASVIFVNSLAAASLSPVVVSG